MQAERHRSGPPDKPGHLYSIPSFRRRIHVLVGGTVIILGVATAALSIALWAYEGVQDGGALDALALPLSGAMLTMAGVLSIWSFRVAMTLGGGLAVGLAICGLFLWHSWSLPTVAFAAIGVTGATMLLYGERDRRSSRLKPSATKDSTRELL